MYSTSATDSKGAIVVSDKVDLVSPGGGCAEEHGQGGFRDAHAAQHHGGAEGGRLMAA